MPRQSKSPLKVRENESEEKEEASLPLPKDQKICKVTKPKGSRASKKENLSDGNQARPRKRALKYPKGLVEELSQPRWHPGGWQCPGGCFGALQGDVGTEPTLPLGRRGNVPRSRSVSLGSDFHLAPEGDRAGGKPEVGVSGEQREEPADFAAGAIADFGIAAGSFGDPCKAQNKVPFKKEPNLEQWRGKFLLDKGGADLRENVSETVTKISKSEPRTCSLLSAHRGGTEPAAPQERVYEQQTPPESLETVVTGDMLETGPVCRAELSPADTRSDVLSGPSRKKVGFVEEPNLGMLDGSKALVTPPVTPRQTGGSPFNGLPRSGSLISILKKTPKKQLLDSPKEHVEPLQEFLEDPVPAENAEAQTDKPDTAKAPPSTKRKCRAKAEEPESSLGSPGNAEGTRNPRKSKIQGPKNPSTSKRTQKTRQTGYGKRRKRKVKKSLYGARQLASKKPLLSPIPEIPEVFSSVSSPDSPKAYPLFSEDAVLDNPKSRKAFKAIQEKAEGMRGKNICVSPSPEDLELAAPGRSRDGTFQNSGAGTDHEEETVGDGNTGLGKGVESPSLEAFRNRLNKFLSGMTHDPSSG
ncbi:hypothetical protein WISP_38518 [Willisornis vidua]|uniref:PP1-binding domain-containing protein n=1 Tax=Willisornis vidua TaxID=1566151 RepID=A0ABQ9DJ14_9PASS|nr:hypothetical protein WISP_38518 [Willisornis vidua]